MDNLKPAQFDSAVSQKGKEVSKNVIYILKRNDAVKNTANNWIK